MTKIVFSPSGRYLLMAGQGGKNNSNSVLMRIYEILFDPKTEEFYLEKKKDFDCENGEYLDVVQSHIEGDDSDDLVLFLTDQMDILAYSSSENILMYANNQLLNDGKVNFDEETEEIWIKTNNMTVILKNGGFAFYDKKDVYFLGINSEEGTTRPLIKVNFDIDPNQMSIDRVCPSQDPTLIVVSFL